MKKPAKPRDKAGRNESDLQDSNNRSAGPVSQVFGTIASYGSQAAGRASTFIVALSLIVVWAVTGPIFGFSDTWQLIINTSTTIVTFLMVFLIQNSQNRDSAALQVKLDELIKVSTVRNSFVGIEHLTDEELEELRSKCEHRAKQHKPSAKKEKSAAVEHIKKQSQRAADAVQS